MVRKGRVRVGAGSIIRVAKPQEKAKKKVDDGGQGAQKKSGRWREIGSKRLEIPKEY